MLVLVHAMQTNNICPFQFSPRPTNKNSLQNRGRFEAYATHRHPFIHPSVQRKEQNTSFSSISVSHQSPLCPPLIISSRSVSCVVSCRRCIWSNGHRLSSPAHLPPRHQPLIGPWDYGGQALGEGGDPLPLLSQPGRTRG